jgi:hypothetical protein
VITICRDVVREPLYTVVPYFNPWRFKSRVKHAERALKHFHDSGAVIVFVEVGFNRRELVFADSGLDGKPAECGILGSDPRFRHKYIGLHTKDEIWLKENAINIGVQHLPYDWQQLCWLDSDVHFVRPNWVGECIHKLQHYKFLQMFSQAQDLGPNYEILDYGRTPSFVQEWTVGVVQKKIRASRPDSYYYPSKGWPGLAWACTRQAWDIVGGLLDVSVVDGGADHDMARLLIEETGLRTFSHPNFKAMLNEWGERCKQGIRRNVGLMDGTILHHWHGRKRDRQYMAKYNLTAGAFDPLRHIKRDAAGLYQLHDDGSENFIRFRDGIRRLAALRKEDANEL